MQFNIALFLVLTLTVAVIIWLGLAEFIIYNLAPHLVFMAAMCLVMLLYFTIQWMIARRLTPVFVSWGCFHWLQWSCPHEMCMRCLTSYGYRLLASKKYELSKKVFTYQLSIDSSQSQAWLNRGYVHFLAEEYEASLVDLNKSIELNPNSETALSYRGYLLIRKGEYAAGIRDLDQIHCASSERATTAWWRGIAHEELENWESAMDDFHLATTLDASLFEPGISFVRIQSGCPDARYRNGKKAIENATTLCHRTGWKDWIAMSVLAAAYAEAGDFPAAIMYAERTLEIALEEEKPMRQIRLKQYENQQPFRIESRIVPNAQNL